ncbi:alpha/beta hydrolase [Curvibacter sp. APW13]|uniref:alpha/beta hydrolase n=1 Tax=Curvibacter sp. APW13 TaxID=3077236 RepID=UPI0028DDD7EF|nr:alpha/beta hydrolase [Curvibacter sp. APW13]MDT8990514.1 alpha/beta hydrolase [Curvibacter sp. APW13]
MRSLCSTVLVWACAALSAWAQASAQVVDLPTRPGVSQRLLVLAPESPKAVVVNFAGGHGGLQISPTGTLGWGEGNFVVRTRKLWVEQGLAVLVIDAPSDRQVPPYLAGNRQTPEHAADVGAAVVWARERFRQPVWLVGTSRGTQSVAYLATELQGAQAPDGIVLTSSIATDPKGRSVNAMPLERVRVPVLVVHHEKDGCSLCAFSDVPPILDKLTQSPRKELISFTGGVSRGDPCEAMAFHGYNGIEAEVVARIAAWIAPR